MDHAKGRILGHEMAFSSKTIAVIDTRIRVISVPVLILCISVPFILIRI